MAHYALIDENNVVVNVIVGRDENETIDGITDWEAHYSEVTGLGCKRTSYNTYRYYEPIYDNEQMVVDEDGVSRPKIVGFDFIESRHSNNGTPFRGQYANIGDIYNAELDEFTTPSI
jgi:hypothetical protein